MRHRVSGRSRPEVEYEPLIQLHGVVVVHASSHWQGETSASENTTQIAESHFCFDVWTTGLCLTLLPHKHPALIGRHTGGGHLCFLLAAAIRVKA